MYVLYRMFFKPCFRCIDIFCCFEKTRQVFEEENVAEHSNFYNCISFATLRRELYSLVQQLEIYTDMYRKNTYDEIFLSSHELKQYIQLLTR